MGNPARELVHILSAYRLWGVSGIYPTRDGVDPGDVQFWRGQARALRLVAEVDQILEARESAGRPVGHYREAMVAAFRCIFAPDVQWNHGGQKVELIPQWAINQIAGLADNIDDVGFSGVTVPEKAKLDIGSVLDDLDELLDSGELPLDGPSSAYVRRLILSIRNLLEDADSYGDVDLLRHI
ncbi:hypothetical protein [Herbiconiux sp. A18JL235]|uniref:DUF1877 family protein n=1 Tax=Herbiconiux sp. A18JL235 TaxID=3152363 RepID=A0AB39BKF1_9MICO